MGVDGAAKKRHARLCARFALMNSTIIFVASHPMSVVAFILPHIRALKLLVPVEVIANSNERTLLQQRGVDIPVDYVQIVRPIAPWSDIKALWVLYWRFKKGRPSAVHTITPKAGLLGMVALVARVPVRVHSFTGQVWLTRTGFLRWLLKLTDKLIAAMATDILVDSSSQRDFLIKQGVVTAENSIVLGAGSICGVDIQRFRPDLEVRKVLRAEMGVSQNTFVCLYLGRLNKEKGVLDLACGFSKFAKTQPNAELWVVGPDEDGIYGEILNITRPISGQVRRVGYTSEPERFMQSADLFCLPSYREGFGSSIIEAAACSVPSLASRIYGLTDSVIEVRTGWMHEAGNISDISNKLEMILKDPDEIRIEERQLEIMLKVNLNRRSLQVL